MLRKKTSPSTQQTDARSDSNVKELSKNVEHSISRRQTEEDEDAPPPMGTFWITSVAALTAGDALHIVLHYNFSVGMISRGGAWYIGCGIWLTICATWAALIVMISRHYVSGRAFNIPKTAWDMNLVLLAEAAKFLIEDCTLVIVVAAVDDDAYVASDTSNKLIVLLSLASSLCTFVSVLCGFLIYWSRGLDEGESFLLFLIFWVLLLAPSCFFGDLLVRLLVQGGLSNLGLIHRIAAWLAYGIQLLLGMFLFILIFATAYLDDEE